MPPATLQTLKAALKTGAFDSAYLFHGDEDYLKEEEVRAIIGRATDAATREFNVDTRHGSEADAADLELVLDALPVMADRRVVVIRDVTRLKKGAREVLERYLKHPAGDTVLVLVAGASTKPEKSLLQYATSIDVRPLSGEELAKWVLHRVSSLDSSISPAVAELLCNVMENDLATLSGEVDKLLTYTDGREIDEAAISAVVGVRRGETLGDLLDLVGRRDGAGASGLVARVLAQPKTTGVFVGMALTTQVLAVGWAIAARSASGRGVRQEHMEREFYSLLGENRSSIVGRPWGEAVKAWVHVIRHWNDASVDLAMDLLLNADSALKESRISSEEQLLSSLFFAMSAGDPASVAST